MLLSEFLREGAETLSASGLGYSGPEAENMLKLLLCERLGVAPYAYLLSPSPAVPEERIAGLGEDLRRLAGGEPLQYVLGKAQFYGRDFRVGPGVLIPRPETELLVERALQEISCGRTRAIDLFTGSGCIPWTLALESPGLQVTAVDLSDEALCYARSQFAGDDSTQEKGRSQFAGDGLGRIGARGCTEGPSATEKPEFIKADILCAPPSGLGQFDILTANPPYICESEKPSMRANVLDHEPSMALFVPDDDPLVFYRATARWACALLRPGGFGIVEINEALGDATAAVFSDTGYSGPSCGNACNGTERDNGICPSGTSSIGTSYNDTCNGETRDNGACSSEAPFKEVAILRDLSGRDRFVTFRK